MPRNYRNPPVVEAACEFRFKTEHPWDWTIPGIIYEKVSATYPEKRQQAGIEVTLGPGETAMVPVPVPPAAISRMQFVKADKTALVQIGPNLLAVNQLPPYPEWPEFKRRIMEQLGIYRDVASPSGFARIGLRYVNKVDIPAVGIELKDYFRALPELPEQLPQVWSAFLMSVNLSHADPAATLRMTVASTPPEVKGHYLVLLDLDLYADGDDLPSFEHTEEWLDIAHGRIEEAFDLSVTEKTHLEIFGEITGAREAKG
jgi:uncharacterized protein (TIGR04255 family)